MPEVAEQPKVKRTPLASLTVKRNETDGLFVDTEVKRGEDKGTPFLQPEVTESNLDTWIAWIGRNNVAAKLQATLRQLSQGWWFEALDQATDAVTKMLNMDKAREVYAELASSFSARGESIPALKAEIEELVNSMTELDMSDTNNIPKFQEYAAQIKSLNIAINSKKRTPKEEKAS